MLSLQAELLHTIALAAGERSSRQRVARDARPGGHERPQHDAAAVEPVTGPLDENARRVRQRRE